MRTIINAALGAVFLSTAFALSPGLGAAHAASCGGPSEQMLTTALAEINQLRQGKGRASVTIDPALVQAAARQACDMARRGRLDHGGSVMGRMRAAGYNPSIAAENIAAGPIGAADAVRIWHQSPPHRANLLNGRLRQIGVAQAVAADGRTRYWALVLASPR